MSKPDTLTAEALPDARAHRQALAELAEAGRALRFGAELARLVRDRLTSGAFTPAELLAESGRLISLTDGLHGALEMAADRALSQGLFDEALRRRPD